MKKLAALIILAVVLVLNGLRFLAFTHEDATSLWFFDVGQGDAALIRDAKGKTLLIDVGPDDSVLKGLEKAMPFWERDIDTVLITHFDADHFLGLFAVMERYAIGEVWTSGAFPTTKEGRRLLGRLAENGIALKQVQQGEELHFQKGNWEIVFPETAFHEKVVLGKNEASLVGTFTCGHHIALMTGDIEGETEYELLARQLVPKVHVLKVAHHGSAHSSTNGFLDAAKPKHAVISSGARNRYGHPAPSVLMRLMERGIRIHRTDRDSHVRFVCDGEKLSAS